MRKKVLKLVLALALLAGGLMTGVPAREASAAGICPDICCDANCFGIRRCFWGGGRCICSQACEPNFPDDWLVTG